MKTEPEYLRYLDTSLFLHYKITSIENWFDSRTEKTNKGYSTTIKSDDLRQFCEYPQIAMISPYIIIVFSTMFIEALIYDYASSRISKSYVDNYLAKLDTPSKWVIATKLITGKDFPVDAKAYQFLKNIFSHRNKLVHYKSNVFSKTNSRETGFEETKMLSANCIDGIKILLKSLMELDEKKDDIDYFLKHIETYQKLGQSKILTRHST